MILFFLATAVAAELTYQEPDKDIQTILDADSHRRFGSLRIA